MLYPERRVIAPDTDRIVFTLPGNGMSTTLFRIDATCRENVKHHGKDERVE